MLVINTINNIEMLETVGIRKSEGKTMRFFVSFISSILLLILLSGSSSGGDVRKPEDFVDYDNSKYWAGSMKWAISEEIIRGYPDSQIKPNELITEKQFFIMLFRFYFPAGYPKIPYVSNNYEYGLAKYFHLPVGELSNFYKPIRRGSVAQIIATAELGKSISVVQSVSWMYDTNLAHGYNENNKTYASFQPNTTLSRAHAVTFLHNYYTKDNLNKTLEKKESEAIEKLNNLYKDKTAFLNRILSYEQQFANDSYSGNRTLRSPVDIINGNRTVILSAPHSTKQLREGNIKDADIYTGALALLLQELTNTPVIFTTKLAEDANYYENGIYKNTLKKLVSENKGKLVIDLHGAASTRRFDIDLGTLDGKSISSEMATSMIQILKSNNINNVTQNDTFKGVSKGTITNYSYNQLHKNSVQMEINKKFRNPREDIDSYYRLVKSLIEIIEMLE